MLLLLAHTICDNVYPSVRTAVTDAVTIITTAIGTTRVHIPSVPDSIDKPEGHEGTNYPKGGKT